MTPDENREWYIYFNEKEMGPVTETQLKTRFEGGELDSSAFVFTEGMSDWTAIDEVKFLTAAANGEISGEINSEIQGRGLSSGQRAHDDFGVSESREYPEQDDDAIANLHQDQNLSVETLGAAPSELGVRDNDQPDFLRLASSAVEDAYEKSIPVRGKLRFLRLAILGFIGLVLIGVFLNYVTVTKPGRPEFLKLILGEKNSLSSSGDAVAPSDAGATQVPDGTAAIPATTADSTRVSDLIWGELYALRKNKSSQGVAYRLSSEFFSPTRPILTGAVSSLIEGDKIHLVVFPELAQNLMGSPRFWWLSVPLVDGYFAAGPLSLEGAPLPVGIYKVLAQVDGRFLGEVSFEVGSFPTGPELVVAQKDLQNSYLMAAAKEQKMIEEIFRSLEGLYEALRQNSAKYALKGKARRAAWVKSKSDWNSAFEKVVLLINRGATLTYFPEVQTKLTDFSKELLHVLGMMDLYNTQGRKAFEKRAGARYSDVWNGLNKDKDFLKSDVANLEGQGVTAPTVDTDLLKANLLNVR